MAKKEELVKRETTELAENNIPDWMLEDSVAMSHAGLEAITASDMEMPRLALAQATHDETKRGHVKQIEGLQPGQFFNTLTKENYGDGPLVVTPLFFRMNRRYFTARTEGSQTLCVSNNGVDGGRFSKLCATCPHAQFGFDTEKGRPTPPACTQFYTYILVLHLPGQKFMPLALSLKKKMQKAAKEWNALMKMRRHAAFAGVYKLSSFLDKGTGGDFFNLKIENAGVLQEREAYMNAKNLWEALKPRLDEIRIHEHNDDAEEGETVDDEAVPF